MRQTFSSQPSRPLTISTTRTPIWPPNPYSPLNNSLGHYIRIQYRCNTNSAYQKPQNEKSNDSHNDSNELDKNEKDSQPELCYDVEREEERRLEIKEKSSLTRGTAVSVGLITHFACPAEREDLRESIKFVTIPSFESGEEFLITKAIDLAPIIQKEIDEISRRDPASKPGGRKTDGEDCERSNVPEPGDVYDIYLTGECDIDWWNWGEVRVQQTQVTKATNFPSSTVTQSQKVDGSGSFNQKDMNNNGADSPDDISDKKFVLLPRPKVNDADPEEYRKMLREKHPDWLPAFGCWDREWEDEEGNEMVYLDVDVDNGVYLSDEDIVTGLRRNIVRPRAGHHGFNAKVEEGRSRFQLRFD